MKRRVDRLLVERGLVESRAKAQTAIAAGRVRAGGLLVTRSSEQVETDATLELAVGEDWVGRGALKLVCALQTWPIIVAGRTVLDIGASTGGFTEACLRAGALRVYAVDVGHGQLHPRLRTDARVVDLAGVDARVLNADLVGAPEVVVCDASFIGLAKVLPRALELAAPGADLVALIKPQFEVGPERVGKGGLVRDEAARLAALDQVRRWLEGTGWTVRDSQESPITGGDGNIEYLLWAQKKGPPA